MRGRFEIIRTLGKGTYGKVKLAIDKSTNTKIAIKYIKKSKIREDDDLERIGREIQIVSTIKHPNIINVKEVFDMKENILLVMDWAPGGELFDYIDQYGPLCEQEAKRVFRQIVSAVGYIHKRGMVHRDLKLENIVIDENLNIKITDFGLSNYYSNERFLTTFCGSPLYASPEILNGIPYYGPEVDCWSLGVILYTLVYGCMPFDGKNLFSLRKVISSAKYKEPVPRSGATDLIRRLLSVEPLRRPLVRDIMQHKWLRKEIQKTKTSFKYKDIRSLSQGDMSSCNLICGEPSGETECISQMKSQTNDSFEYAQIQKPLSCDSVYVNDSPKSILQTHLNDRSPGFLKCTVLRVLQRKLKYFRKGCRDKGKVRKKKRDVCDGVLVTVDSKKAAQNRGCTENVETQSNLPDKHSSWVFTPVMRSQKILNKDNFFLRENRTEPLSGESNDEHISSDYIQPVKQAASETIHNGEFLLKPKWQFSSEGKNDEDIHLKTDDIEMFPLNQKTQTAFTANECSQAGTTIYEQ